MAAANAQQANASTAGPARAASQELQVAVPTSRIELYTGLRVNGDTDWMLGAEYLHRRPEWKKFGAAAFLELVFASDLIFMFGATAQYFVTPQLVVETGPGFAVDGGSDFLWRLGAEYELKMTSLSLVPKFYMDFVYGTTIYGFGVAIGLPR
jgi:hypothetical protein